MADLTPKQQRFVDEYAKDPNATQAAIRAGYSKRSAMQMAGQNMRKPEIKQAIESRRSKVSDRAEINAAWVLKGFQRNAERGLENDSPQWATVANTALSRIGDHLGMFAEKQTGGGITLIFDMSGAATGRNAEIQDPRLNGG